VLVTSHRTTKLDGPIQYE